MQRQKRLLSLGIKVCSWALGGSVISKPPVLQPGSEGPCCNPSSHILKQKLGNKRGPNLSLFSSKKTRRKANKAFHIPPSTGRSLLLEEKFDSTVGECLSCVGVEQGRESEIQSQFCRCSIKCKKASPTITPIHHFSGLMFPKFLLSLQTSTDRPEIPQSLKHV